MIPRVIKKAVDLNAAQKVDQLSGPLYQLENGGHKFEITILKDGAPTDISGSVTARFVRADGETVFFSGTLTDNVASVTLPQNCYLFNGRFGLVVFVSGSGVTSAVYALTGMVYKTTTDAVIDPEDTIPSIEDIMGIIDDCITATTNANAAADNATAAAGHSVRFDTAQALTNAEKAQARENIGATAGAVRYDEAQSLTEQQKTQARTNIGLNDIPSMATGTVKYDQQQSLTDPQKGLARANISAAGSAEISTINSAIAELQADFEEIGNVVADVVKTESGIRVEYTDGTSKNIAIESGGSEIDSVVYDEDHYLHFYDENGEDLYNPVFIKGGGSGGGSTVGTVTITRITNASADCIYGDAMPILFSFTATDSSGDAVGSGIGTWSIGGVVVARNVAVPQGANSFDIGPYLTAGANSVKLSVSVDTGGDTNQTATKTWTVNAVNLMFVWPYDDSQVNTSGFSDRWTPYGDIQKTTHTRLDGVELETSTTTRSGVQQSLAIPMQSHGAHAVERWITASINGVTQNTAVQYHEMIFAVEGNMSPIVAISMQDGSMNQYDTIRIPVVVYNPSALLTDASLAVDGVQIGTWENIDRSLRYWTYTPTTSGTHTLSVSCGATTRTLTLNVAAVSIDAEEVAGYSFRFKSSEMSTNSAVQGWVSNGVTAQFSQNFDWINGGLHTESDENGALQQYLCIKAGTRMTINHKLFSTDPKSAGMNYKIIFKVKNVRNYNAQIGHCYADGVGIRMYAHESVFNSSGMSINVPYGEDEYIELEFDVYPAPRQENDGNYRYMMAWIDGVITTCRVYGANDNFVQSVQNQEGIVLGSDDCDLYVYMVKAYPMLMTRDNHIDNFIMDAPNASEMVRRYNRNDILDEAGQISYEKLLLQNPDCRVFLYDIPYLTNGKKDKVDNCQFHQFWPNGDRYYELSGTCTMTVQGTSSVKYIHGAANTDSNFTALTDGYGNNLLAGGVKDEAYGNNLYMEDAENPGHAKVYTPAEAREEAGITDQNEALGTEWIVVSRDVNRTPTGYIKALGFRINEGSSPITYSNVKVNFASCEQVNNMCNAIWYQRFNPYPSLTSHDCMEFSMGVQFIKDSGTIPDDSHFVLWGDNKYHMYSIANMGNSKKNVHVFHDLSNPNEVCIEVNDNDKDQMRMVSDDLSAEDWSGDVYFGMRYPDTKNPSQQIRDAWQRLVSWMARSNPNAATGDALDRPETYGVYTFRGHDRPGTQVLRGTTVTRYAGTYTHDTFERRMAKMLSECEDYLVMDSFVYHFVYIERHTMVDNVSKNNFWSSTDLLHWDLSKAYDMDTSDGNNNQGQMVFDYGNEYNDDIGGMKVFNAADAVWFVFVANLYEACRTMFTNREGAGAWSATAYHNLLLSEQQKVPERCWVETYWYDYLRTYEQGISTEWMTFLDGGQKTHQRKHFEYFEELYDSSKYRGTASTSQNVNFRAYTPNTWAGVEPRGELTVTMYNKMYISVDVGTTALEPVKAERGQPTVIDFSSGGTLNNTMIAINTASMIQAISGMEQLYPDTCVFSAAIRLRELTIGSDAAGYQNTFLQTLALENNTMLERLYVQNLPNATSVLDLSHCPALLYVDAGGSGFTGYEFADGGLLTTAILNRPTSLNLRNLANLQDQNFIITDLTGLITLRHENTLGVDSLALVNNAPALKIVRLVGIDWLLSTTDVLDRMYGLQGLDENNYTINRSVLSGEAHVPVMTQRKLDMYDAAWPNLDVDYGSMTTQYAVRFYNADGTAIKDLYGIDYVQYVDRGSSAYDPVQAGEVLTPVKATDAQYTYTFSGWDNLAGTVLESKDVTATYTATTRSYTVRWYSMPGTMLKQVNALYGAEVKFNEDPHVFPSLTDEESSFVYKVFKGWDKSTGYITGDTDVYAQWDRAALPQAGTVDLMDMSVAQIYSIARNNAAAANWTVKDYIDITVGKDFNFTNVESFLICENRFFDGNERNVLQTNIKLFDADAPTFTMAIDYEFVGTTSGSTLVSCFEEDGSEGFRLRYNNTPDIQWGDSNMAVSETQDRNIVVIRHIRGSNILYIAGHNMSASAYDDASFVSGLVRTRATNTNAELTLGGVPFGDSSYGNLAVGWVYWCKIWYADLGNTVIRQIAEWPHETWRMQYNGAGRYRLAGETADVCAASFTAAATLQKLYRMNESDSNAGGWATSKMRTFVNGRCFDALPYAWQDIIQKVKINTTSGGQSTLISTSEDAIYLPALAEVNAMSEEPFVSEGTLIPWFVNNTSRFVPMGYTVPENAQYIVSASDPTMLTELYTVNEGDVWMRNNRGYIYLSEQTSQRHYRFGILPITSEFIIRAGGAQGGIWFPHYFWQLRTPVETSSINFYTIANNGVATYSTSGNEPNAILLGFSI